MKRSKRLKKSVQRIKRAAREKYGIHWGKSLYFDYSKRGNFDVLTEAQQASLDKFLLLHGPKVYLDERLERVMRTGEEHLIRLEKTLLRVSKNKHTREQVRARRRARKRKPTFMDAVMSTAWAAMTAMSIYGLGMPRPVL